MVVPSFIDTNFYSIKSRNGLASPTYLPFMASSYCLFDFQVMCNRGNPVSLKKYVGKKAYIIVNTHDGGAFKKQHYRELQELYDKYGSKLEILAFPVSNFGAQSVKEEGSDKYGSFKSSVSSKKECTFPVFGSINCENGENTHPLYDFLKKTAPRYTPIEWDFVKFICDANGKVIARFPPEISPKGMEEEIIKLIKDENNIYREKLKSPRKYSQATINSDDSSISRKITDHVLTPVYHYMSWPLSYFTSRLSPRKERRVFPS